MSCSAKLFTLNYYGDRLIGVGSEIVLRADDLLGDIDGVSGFRVSFEISPNALIEITVQKEYVSEYKQFKVKNREGQ